MRQEFELEPSVTSMQRLVYFNGAHLRKDPAAEREM
jgi:hypothetical protein